MDFMEVEEDSDNSSNKYIRPKFDMMNPETNATLATDLELMVGLTTVHSLFKRLREQN